MQSFRITPPDQNFSPKGYAMEPQNIDSAYERVKKEHAEKAEQMMVLKSVLPYLNDPKNLEKIEQVVDFFKKRVIPHFQWEERDVFPVALAMGDLEFKKMVRQLQVEHILMIGNFEVMTDIIVHHGLHFQEEELKKKFVCAASGIIETMIPHARTEDARLYAFLRKQGVALTVVF
jgi:hemerythrin-like domain-containing protein